MAQEVIVVAEFDSIKAVKTIKIKANKMKAIFLSAKKFDGESDYAQFVARYGMPRVDKNFCKLANEGLLWKVWVYY